MQHCLYWAKRHEVYYKLSQEKQMNTVILSSPMSGVKLFRRHLAMSGDTSGYRNGEGREDALALSV